MRVIIAFSILLLGLSSAAPEPEFSSLFDGYLQVEDGSAGPSLVEIESATGRSDRLPLASSHILTNDASTLDDVTGTIGIPNKVAPPLTFASASAELEPGEFAGLDSDNTSAPEVSVDDLCNALYTSAQNNDLPIPFFANLIWQESRLRDDAVSKKGALGIAQFMPKVAVEKGLDDPLDPMQALPASARLLRELRLQFGNLGFVAAAYNAGPRRVIEWLEHRRDLPRETRDYVVRITGLSIEAWRSMPVNSDALTFVQHLPCRSLPAFADVEQTQSEEAQVAEAKLEQAKLDEPPAADTPVADDAPSASETGKRGNTRHGIVRDNHDARHDRHEASREARHADHEHHAAKREAAHTPHAAREKRRSA